MRQQHAMKNLQSKFDRNHKPIIYGEKSFMEPTPEGGRRRGVSLTRKDSRINLSAWNWPLALVEFNFFEFQLFYRKCIITSW